MQLNTTLLNDYCKIYVADPEYTHADALAAYFRVHRKELMQELHQYGILLFRGFKVHRSYEFHELIKQHLKLEPNNKMYRPRRSWLTSLLYKYRSNIIKTKKYIRFLDPHPVPFNPVKSSIQGPHVEGGSHSERYRYLAMFCKEPSIQVAETGFNNLEKIWNHFPTRVQQKYLGAWNHFSFISPRKLNLFERLLLKKGPFRLSRLPNRKAKLTLKRSPFVIVHPETRKKAIQPWAFAHNTNRFVHQAAQACFKDRGMIQPDANAERLQLSWDLFTKSGKKIEWTDQEKQHFFDALYRDAVLVQWEKGDIAIVDNIKIAHWRMNGEHGKHKLVQIQANIFHADQHHAI